MPGRLRLVLAAVAVSASLAAGSIPAPTAAHSLENYAYERGHIVNRAHSVIGTPYRYGGTTPSGFDCSGFTSWVFAGHGTTLPRTSMDQYGLGDRPGHKRIYKRENLKPGDLVFHRTTSATVGHVGIYIGKGRFISSTSSEGVQVRDLYDPYYWGELWVGGVRLPVTKRDTDDRAPSSHPVDGRSPDREGRSPGRGGRSSDGQDRSPGDRDPSSKGRGRDGEEPRPGGFERPITWAAIGAGGSVPAHTA